MQKVEQLQARDLHDYDELSDEGWLSLPLLP